MLTKHRTAFFLVLALAVAAILAFEPSMAWAASSAGDPFIKADDKGKELHTWISGNLAVTVTAVVIAVTGILMLMSRISHFVGIRIIFGALIIGSSLAIAEWAYK